MLKTALFAAALSVAACVPALAQMPEMMMKMKPGMTMSEAGKGYMGAMQMMHKDMMTMEMTGDPEGDFVRMMIPHHQSAVAMADVLLQQPNVDAEIKAMAEKIKSGQQQEIDAFQKWLAAHPE